MVSLVVNFRYFNSKYLSSFFISFWFHGIILWSKLITFQTNDKFQTQQSPSEVPFIKAIFKSKVKSFLNVCEGGHLSYSGEPKLFSKTCLQVMVSFADDFYVISIKHHYFFFAQTFSQKYLIVRTIK